MRARTPGFFVGIVAFLAVLTPLAAHARSVTVIATDEAGKPVPGARVICVPTDHSSFRTEPLKDSEQGVTAEDGRCTFTDLPMDTPMGERYFTYYIFVTTESLGARGRADFNTDNAPDDTVELPLTLSVGRTLPGRAVDAAGKPIADALVFERGAVPLGVTDVQGAFRVPNVAAEEMIETHFIKPGYGFLRDYARPAMQEYEVTLLPGGLVRGQVVMPSGEAAVGAIYRAYPFDGKAGSDGVFEAGWYSVDTQLTIQASYHPAEVHFSGETKLKVAAGDNTVTVQLTPPEDKPKRSISGRVSEKGTGEPVQAEIFGEYSSMFEWPKRLARTGEDGRYRIDGVAGDMIYLYAKPVKGTLYGLEGLVRVDLRERETVEGIDFTVDRGCAIRGKVVDHEGNPVEQVQVLFNPMKPFYRAIWTSPSGRFLIDNLPDANIMYKVEVTTPLQQAVTEAVGPLKPGETGEVTLQFPMPVAQTTVRGLVLDSEGNPVAGANVLFPTSTKHIWTNTDQEGRFLAEFHGSADADVQVSVQKEVKLGQMQMNVGPQITVLEGGHITAPEGAEVEQTIRIEMAPMHTLGGGVQNSAGEAIDARVEALGDEYARADINEQNGRFFARSLPESPFVLEFTAQGYQAKVLVPGDDFRIGDEDLVVTLQAGPFPEGESVWKAVTGREELETEIAKMPGGREVFRRAQDMYPRLARPVEPRPQQPQTPTPTPVKTRVVTPEGSPVARIVLWPQRVDPNTGVAGTPVFEPDPNAATEIRTSEDGVYDLWGGTVFTAEGTAPGWVPGNTYHGEPAPKEATVTLYPASTVTIRVVGYDGKPVPDLAVGMTYQQPGNNYERYDKTNAAGEIVFEQLNPLFYSFEVARPATYSPDGGWEYPEAQSRYVGLKVEPEQQYEREIVFGIAPEGTAQRLFDQWHRSLQTGGIEEKDYDVPAGLRAELGDIVSQRFAALRGKPWAENREAAFLLRLTKATELAGALPGLEEYFLRLEFPPVFPAPPIEATADVIAAVGGDDAARFLAETAMTEDVSPAVRLEAAISIGETKSAKAPKHFLDMLKEARKQVGLKPADTPEAQIAQTLYLVFYVIPALPEAPKTDAPPADFPLTITGDTAEAEYGGRIVELKKVDGEWAITNAEQKVVVVP